MRGREKYILKILRFDLLIDKYVDEGLTYFR